MPVLLLPDDGPLRPRLAKALAAAEMPVAGRGVADPEVAVLDFTAPGARELSQQLPKRSPAFQWLAVVDLAAPESLTAAEEAGASDFVSAERLEDELAPRLRRLSA